MGSDKAGKKVKLLQKVIMKIMRSSEGFIELRKLPVLILSSPEFNRDSLEDKDLEILFNSTIHRMLSRDRQHPNYLKLEIISNFEYFTVTTYVTLPGKFPRQVNILPAMPKRKARCL